jgi:hypothetical protein
MKTGELMARIMKPSLALLITLLQLLLASIAYAFEAPPAARDTPQGELHNVTARVGYGFKNPYAFAELEPGPFTVPQGYVATKLLYRWEDSKTDRKNDRLTATTIYSVTRGGYVAEAKDNPDVVLPAGDYKLVCGGMAGASGVLTYRLIREDLVDRRKESDVPGPDERIIDVVTWASTPRSDYNPKLKATYRVRGGKVTGTIDQLVEPPKYEGGVTCDPFPTKGTFSGEISGNVITGKWEVKTAAHKMRFAAKPGTDYPDHDRTDTWSQSYEIRLTLNSDGTLSESMKGSGVMELVWGPTAPKAIANQRDSHHFDFEVPGKDFPEPMQGTWKERK